MGKENLGVIELSKKYRSFDNSEWQDYLTEEDEDVDRGDTIKNGAGINGGREGVY